MHSIYNFVSGPLAWAAFIIFIGGSLCRLVRLFMLVHKKERFIYTYMSWKYALRSILRWSTPFATENMRRNPALTIVAFAFHISFVTYYSVGRILECKLVEPARRCGANHDHRGDCRLRVFPYPADRKEGGPVCDLCI